MPNETRVNIRHLLEDIRDSYTHPLEEVILTELIANALDGKASEIHFVVDADKKFIRVMDNGGGMKRPVLREYHNIAASIKTRGMGIGFAGVGAKLSLLIAQKVITESKGGHGTKSATEWNLSGHYRAPWKFTPFSGVIVTPRGTAVTIYFESGDLPLLNPDFIRKTIVKHFYPLLAEDFYQQFLRYFYKKPVNFFVNGEKIVLPEEKEKATRHWFNITVGKSRRPEGFGFLAKTGEEQGWLERMLGQKPTGASLSPGLWISTFGKVIKGGWEWSGIAPKNAQNLIGLVEIPSLSQILTTNKNDFLSDSASLKRYYRYRKAVQEAVLPALKLLGESETVPNVAPEKLIRPLNRTIVGALNRLVGDFPELESLLGARRAEAFGRKQKVGKNDDKKFAAKTNGEFSAGQDEKATVLEIGAKEIERENKKSELLPGGVFDESSRRKVKAKTAGLKLLLTEIANAPEIPLGRVVEDTLTINTAHPAWQKAKRQGLEEYHIVVAVASTLSQFLESEKKPQDFLNRLLVAWAGEATEGEKPTKEKSKKLFD